jgi:hypothetical protein
MSASKSSSGRPADRRRAGLQHQQHRAAFGMVGQNRGSAAVVLDLAANLDAVVRRPSMSPISSPASSSAFLSASMPSP